MRAYDLSKQRFGRLTVLYKCSYKKVKDTLGIVYVIVEKLKMYCQVIYWLEKHNLVVAYKKKKLVL